MRSPTQVEGQSGTEKDIPHNAIETRRPVGLSGLVDPQRDWIGRDLHRKNNPARLDVPELCYCGRPWRRLVDRLVGKESGGSQRQVTIESMCIL